MVSDIFDISNFPFDLTQLPQPAYIVGGWVRDRLLGRKAAYLDLDFVMAAQAVETARKIAKQHSAGFVVLDADRQIARVVFKTATVDFAQQMGDSLTADLRRRDYTMNAIAVDCQRLIELNQHRFRDQQNISLSQGQDTVNQFEADSPELNIINEANHDGKIINGDDRDLGASEDDRLEHCLNDPELAKLLIDPLSGSNDLTQKIVRMVAPANLIDDPLRILRAYRQVAQLNFSIEPKTRACLVELAAQPKVAGKKTSLGSIAAERIRTELVYLLNAPGGSDWFGLAVEDGILRDWLPTQHLRPERLAKITPTLEKLCQTWPELTAYFEQVLAGDRPRTIATKLAALTNSATALEPLGFSKAEQKFYTMLLRYLPPMVENLSQPIANISAQEQYHLFQATGDAFPAVIALTLAHRADFNQNLDTNLKQATPWLERWLAPADPIAHPVNLLSGNDLIKALNLPASPQIGELLTAIKLAQVEGIVQNYAGAIAYAKKLVIMKNSGQ